MWWPPHAMAVACAAAADWRFTNCRSARYVSFCLRVEFAKPQASAPLTVASRSSCLQCLPDAETHRLQGRRLRALGTLRRFCLAMLSIRLRLWKNVQVDCSMPSCDGAHRLRMDSINCARKGRATGRKWSDIGLV